MGETANRSLSYRIEKDAYVPFENHVTYCIGTGRMGLALQKEYQDQLELVQSEIGFSYIRGHGLFSDDMAIYHEFTDKEGNVRVEYNFTYLDFVMDSYQRLNIRPFLELGFMPRKMASGDQTVFYWKGNVTPPKSYDAWRELVQATLKHLLERYGRDEVVTWPIEVWNEPNLEGFWKGADMQEYFKLFALTFKAVKEVDECFKVGGPAICGVDDERWIRLFLEFCKENEIPVDFITRHHYTTEVPEMDGHYGYAKLSNPEVGFANLQTTRDIVDSFEEFAGKDIHITEFNTSYIPNCPLHDTNRNAAYIAHQLSRLGSMNASYSYWTFGDIFEEQGVPFTPFHGGFGLVANGGIPKPTFYSFQFFKDLQGECVFKSDEAVIVKRRDGSYCGVVWNETLNGTGDNLEFHLILPMQSTSGICSLLTKTVDEFTCNPLNIWHAMGEPSSLTKKQLKILKESAVPFVFAERKPVIQEQTEITLSLSQNAVVYFEITAIRAESDRGYSYQKAIGV